MAQKPIPFRMRENPVAGLCPVWRCNRRRGNRCSLCSMHHKAAWRINNPEKAAFQRLRQHARERGKPFDIDLNDFLAITNIQDYITDDGVHRHCLSLDRKDDKKGYVPGNIMVITMGQNRDKQTLDMRAAKVKAKVDSYISLAHIGTMPQGCGDNWPF